MKGFVWGSILSLIIPSIAFSQECTHLWQVTLDINPATPKPMSGDTYAAYGLLGYYNDPNLRLEMKGNFLKGRFMSFESYRTKQKLKFEALFDYQMHADAGSENPYVEGVAMNTPNRAYTLDVVTKGVPHQANNVIHVSRRARIASIFYRAYVPSEGVTLTMDDLPRIFAYNAVTGAPAACPRTLDTVYDPGLITLLLNFISEKPVLEFKEGGFWNGTNHAIPKYVHAVSKVPQGSVSVVRFRAPTFTATNSGVGPFPTSGEVRYWSFCIQNLKESSTLGCVPDYLAKINESGMSTIVVGRGDEVRQAAEARGYNFLEDRRLADQEVLGFFYRNLLPSEGFPMYEGDYLPVGKTCTKEDFLSQGCE